MLVARRENLLKEVADRAIVKGASDVKVIVGDVTKEEDCKLFVDETIKKYGRCKNSLLSVNKLSTAHTCSCAMRRETELCVENFHSNSICYPRLLPDLRS